MVLWEQRMSICLRKLDWANTLRMNSFDGQEMQSVSQCKDMKTVWETSMRNLDCINRWQDKTQEFKVSQWYNQIVFYKGHNFAKGGLEGAQEWRQ